jgi:hypothetical protein
VVVAALLVLRWLTRRADTLGRPRPFPTISVVLALAVAVASGVPVVRHARFEHRLSTAASVLINAEVSVRCQTMSQAWTEAHPEAGYVRFGPDDRPEPLATITLDTCEDLRSWVGSDHGSPTRRQLIAVHVLTHETMHLAGIRDEAMTECAAVQRDSRTAMLLGADESQAMALASAYWQQIYPLMPDAYRTADCGSRLRLDERLGMGPWESTAAV